MPKNCGRCPFSRNYERCQAMEGKELSDNALEKREEWCPLEEV